MWTEYLPKEFHDLLPSLRNDSDVYSTSIALLTAGKGISSFDGHAKAHREDWHGLYDPVLRMADMDREGVSAELIYLGDSRLGDMFHNVTGRAYSLDAWDAGAKGWNRWAADNFGFAPDRFLVTGAIGPCVDMEASVAEVHWMADHKFVGVYGPGYLHHADMPPLYDPYWDPYLGRLRGTGHRHRGPRRLWHRVRQGVPSSLEKIYNDVAKAAGSTDRDGCSPTPARSATSRSSSSSSSSTKTWIPAGPCGR